MPDVLAAEGEAVALQAHVLIGDGAGEDHQVGPGDLVAVLLLDRPEEAAGLVEGDVVRPGVQRREALVAGAAAAAAIGDAVGAGRVPGHADHQAAIVTPVGRPPALALGHQGMDVALDRVEIERLHRLAVAEARAHRIGLGVVLMQNVEVQRIRPPVHHRPGHGGVASVHDRAFAGRRRSVHLSLRSWLVACRLAGARARSPPRPSPAAGRRSVCGEPSPPSL